MASACDIAVRFHEPPVDLRPYFTTFYRADFTVPQGRVRDALQPEWGGIRFFRGDRPVSRIGDTTLSQRDFSAMGPTSRPIEFEIGTTRFWGIGFLPLGWATFMGVPADSMANGVFDGREHPAFAQFLPLADELSADPAKENDELALIIKFFRHQAPRQDIDEGRILAVHKVVIDPEVSNVVNMALKTDLSLRTLERVCRKVFGFPPKTLLRRQRFMRSLARFMVDPKLGWIGAMDSLYFDQSQFVRDCHDFLGMAPSEYVAMEHPILDAFMRERQRAYGSAAQTLDKPD